LTAETIFAPDRKAAKRYFLPIEQSAPKTRQYFGDPALTPKVYRLPFVEVNAWLRPGVRSVQREVF
jgi:hypothetical protein